MLYVASVIKKYRGIKDGHFTALNEVSFEVKAGEIFGVIGLSGAGKSTLLRSIIGLESLDAGHIQIDGVELASLKGDERRRFLSSIGVVFQGYHLFMQKNVFDNIAFPLRLAHYNEYDTRMRVQELLAVVGLVDKADAYPSQLSGGQRQRVAIARALALQPKLLLLDELTSALDPLTTKQILQLLKNIQRQFKVTIFLITHEMAVVRALCDHVAVLDQGRIVETGTVHELLTSPQTEVTRLLLGEVVLDA